MARSGLKNFATFAGSFAVSGTCIYMLGNYLPFYVVTVSGDSMQPALNPKGSTSRDKVLVRRLSSEKAVRLFTSRGDIVDAINPRDVDGDLTVKRLLGLPCDTLLTPRYRDEVVKLKHGMCWLEGDNWRVSADSNYYGPIPVGTVKGKVLYVVWPPSRIGRVAERSMAEDQASKMSSLLYS